MSVDLVSAVTAIAVRLIALAADDAELRAHLRQLAQAVLEATERPEPQHTAAPVNAERVATVHANGALSLATDCADVATPELSSSQRTETSVESQEPLPELTLGRSAPSAEPLAAAYPLRWSTTNDVDFSLIESRCRLKAEAARWAASRHRLISEGATFSTEIDPTDRDLISRARLIPDCFLWMCHPSAPSPSDVSQYELVAACFDVVANALAVLKMIQNDPDLYQGLFACSLDLLAEAQSALRVAIDFIGGPTDSDQSQVFNWLKATASESQIFIRRYMRVDDPANPSQSADLSSRIEAVRFSIEETRRRAKQRRKLLGKVRHKLSLIASEPEAAVEHWQLLASAVDQLVSDGLPPSNRELRELLIPAIDDLPELSDVPRGFQLVLREIDRFMANSPLPEGICVTGPTPEVQEAARLLKGRSMVLIGGDRRPGSHQALEEAFGLQELIWIETREHQSISGFEPYVARPDVAVVILAIRWSSHSFGEVRDFCNRYGKPLVRLPGGYSPNQVAAQIMGQCSERLQAK